MRQVLVLPICDLVCQELLWVTYWFFKFVKFNLIILAIIRWSLYTNGSQIKWNVRSTRVHGIFSPFNKSKYGRKGLSLGGNEVRSGIGYWSSSMAFFQQFPGLWIWFSEYKWGSNSSTQHLIVGLRPALEGFVVTMHEGACETGSQIPTA